MSGLASKSRSASTSREMALRVEQEFYSALPTDEHGPIFLQDVQHLHIRPFSVNGAV